MTTQGRLPDGKYTTSTSRYVSEWRKVNAEVERRLGARVYAFDPGVAVCQPDGTGHCTLPMWVVRRLVDEQAQA